MFRSPFIVSAKDFPMSEEFTKFISKAIEKELRPYFIDEDGYDRIEAGGKDVLVHCSIPERELLLVDKRAVAALFPKESAIFFPDLCLRTYIMKKNVPEQKVKEQFYESTMRFLSKKFIQLVKLIKSEEVLTPDLFMEAMLFLVAENAEDRELEFDGKKELVDAIIDFTISGEGCSSDLVDEIKERTENAAHSLRSMLIEEDRSEIGWLLWDLDLTYLLEGDCSGLTTLLTFDGAYSEDMIKDIYMSVGESTPFTIETVLERRRALLPKAEEIRRAAASEMARMITGEAMEY